MELNDFFPNAPRNKNGDPVIGMKIKKANDGITFYQFRVLPTRNGKISKWGCDDETYKRFPELMTLLPRSFSVWTYTDEKGKEVIGGRIHGIPKFGGLNDAIDEDNDDDSQLGLTMFDMMSKGVIRVLMTTKDNGKFCLISAFVCLGKTYIVIGSKNVHTPIPLNDLATAELNGLADQIRKAFLEQYDPVKHGEVIQRLTEGYSLIGEFNNGKHMIPLDGGKPYIRFFGISDSNADLTGNLAGNITTSLDYLQRHGFSVVENTNISMEEYVQQQDGRVGHGEGRVDYFLTKEGRVVGIAKHKKIWYILIRMLRQIIMKGEPHMYEQRIKTTLIARNSFLHLPEGYLQIWYDLLCHFARWFHKKGYEPKTVGIQDTSKGMGNIWKEFLIENPDVTDDFAPPLEEMKKRGIPHGTTFKIQHKNCLAVILQGIPGIGKNTVADWVAQNLTGLRVIVLDQDTFTSKVGRKKAGKACLNEWKMLINTGDYDVVILARNNAAPCQYNTYADVANEALWKTIVVRPEELDTRFNEQVAVCIESVMTRSEHPTMGNCTPEKKMEILAMFANWVTQQPRVTDKINFVGALRYLAPNTEFNQGLDSQIGAALSSGSPLPHDVTGMLSHRRTIEQIGCDLRDIITKFITAPVSNESEPQEEPEPLYVGLFLQKQQKENLIKLIPEMKDVPKKKTRKHFGHTTLGHRLANPDEWEKAKTAIGLMVNLVITGYVVKGDDTIVVRTQVQDRDGNDRNDLVLSGVPHITGVLPRAMKAAQSKEILQSGEYDREVVFETPIVHELEVKAHYQ